MVVSTQPHAAGAGHHEVIEREAIAVRFCGDSGDGMQLAGTQMTNTSAIFGNDVSTFPDYPAEIRAQRANRTDLGRAVRTRRFRLTAGRKPHDDEKSENGSNEREKRG